MAETGDKNPLVTLYGVDAFNLAYEEIKVLQQNSNIPFDSEYVKMGISFIAILASEIVEGKRKKSSLKDLVRDSFGKAAIYKYNIAE